MKLPRELDMSYREGAEDCTASIVAPAHISLLNAVFARFIVPLIAAGRFWFIPPVYWTLQDLKDSVNKQ
jgi:hypothetical protein